MQALHEISTEELISRTCIHKVCGEGTIDGQSQFEWWNPDQPNYPHYKRGGFTVAAHVEKLLDKFVVKQWVQLSYDTMGVLVTRKDEFDSLRPALSHMRRVNLKKFAAYIRSNYHLPTE